MVYTLSMSARTDYKLIVISMRQTEKEITVIIARMGNDPLEVKVPVDSTVAKALEVAGISLPTGGQVSVEGVEATGNDILDDGDVLSIFTPKAGGIK